MKWSWTKPYYGVQHLQQHVPGIRQITLTDYGNSFVEVWALGLEGFTPFWKEHFSTVAEAMAAAQHKAEMLGGKGA